MNKGRLFIRGDVHGAMRELKAIKQFCKKNNTTKDDIMVLLGDVGLNYYLDETDILRKEMLASCNCTFICVHGNHEERPQNINSYLRCSAFQKNYSGTYWYELEYPNILFAEDGLHIIQGKNCLVLGGAYSVDKEYRLMTGKKWFKSEQMDDFTKQYIRENTNKENKIDYVFSHTAPLKFEPTHLFLSMIDQSKVDKSMETFLDEIEDKIEYNHWYFGHYHSNEKINEKVTLLFENIIEVEV